MRRLSLILLLLVACIGPPVADAADPARIIVSDVRLAGREAASADVAVNLLIVDGELVVITEDQLVIRPGDIAVDANGGFVFGELSLDSPPSFVILDEDPRDNVDVLLDTKAHALFAIRQGEIIKNELQSMPVTSDDALPNPRKWAVYTPPPIAVPIRYFDSTKWNKFETKPISGLVVAAGLLDRQYWLSQDDESEGQVGDLSDFEGGEIRGARIGVVGTINLERPWRYTVFAATNAFDKGFDVETTDDFFWTDYRLDIPITSNLLLSVGKQKEPISMERLMALAYLPMQERSVVSDVLLPARNFGAILSGTTGSGNMSWAVGAFNNWIDSDESFSDTSSQLVGRVTWVPQVFQSDSNILHLGFGMRNSNAKQPLRAIGEPEFNNAPPFVDTGSFSAEGQVTYNLETYWRNGPYMLGFEYTGTDIDTSGAGSPFLSGYHITGSWAVTGEMRGYRKRSGTFDPLPVARPVDSGGWGALELAFRYSDTDLNDGSVEGGDIQVYSLGLNWWFTRSASFGLNYRYIELDRFDTQGDSSGLNARIMLTLD